MGNSHWWRDVTFYQIYLRSFSDSDGDGIGDLPGVLSRLDYLNDGTDRGLGIGGIWLTPFYPSPMADGGYDVTDHVAVDPTFGTLRDFERLVRRVHERGMRLIVDWIPNHSSDQHPWFLDSRSSRRSPRRDWYVWRKGGHGSSPPNNWLSFFPAVGSAWSFARETNEFYLHSFSRHQPDLNWDSPAVEEAMLDTLRFWLDLGVDGFRIDALPLIGKDPELRDNRDGCDPWGERNIDWPSVHERVRRIRGVVAAYGDAVLVGEVNLRDPQRVAAYVTAGDELDLVQTFLLSSQPWSVRAFRGVVEGVGNRAAWPAWYLNNHDHGRVVSRYGQDAHGEGRGRVAGMLLLTLRGTPFLYQGEELGIADVPIAPEQRRDAHGRDPQRAPIPWEPIGAAGPGAGFTTSVPWLPIGAQAERLNVARERDDRTSMWSLYHRLLRLRADHAALRAGSYSPYQCAEDVYAYARALGSDRILVALNFGVEEHRLQLPAELGESGTLALSTDALRSVGGVSLAGLALGPLEGLVVVLP